MTRIQLTRTPDGRRLEVSHVVDAPAADAWDLLVDTTRWPDWSPIVSGVESSERLLRLDTTGRIRALGVWVSFRVTAYRPDERRWAWRISGLPGAGHRVDDLETDRCRIAFELPPTATGYAPVCLRALERLEDLLTAEAAAD